MKTFEVESADKIYFWTGISSLILLFILESVVIREFLTAELGEALAISFIMQIPAFLLITFISCINDYRTRKKFLIYVEPLNNHTNINYVKENYCIIKINSEKVAYVKPEDYKLYLTWNVFHEIDLYESS